MKEGIHPTFHDEAVVVCASCGTEWPVGSTVENLRVDICANCHPFYTGEQKIVDTEGRVDRFMNRLRVRDQRQAERQAQEEAKVNTDIPLEELGIAARYVAIMKEADINLVSDLVNKLETEGDDAILGLPGIGIKILADAKRKMSELGYWSGDQAE